MLQILRIVFITLAGMIALSPLAKAAPEVFLQATFSNGSSALGTLNLGQTGEGFAKAVKFESLTATDPISVGMLDWNYTLSTDEGYRFVRVTKHHRQKTYPYNWESNGELLTTYELSHYALPFSISKTEEDFLLRATVEFTNSVPRNGTVYISGIQLETGTILSRRTTVDDYTDARTYLPASYYKYAEQPLAIETNTTEPQIGFMINPDSEEGKLHRYLYSVKVNGKEAERGFYKYADENTPRLGCFPLLKDGDNVSLMGFGTIGGTFNLNIPIPFRKECRSYPDIRRRPEDMNEGFNDVPAWGTAEFKLDELSYFIHSVKADGKILTPDADGWYVVEDINHDIAFDIDAEPRSLMPLDIDFPYLELDKAPAIYVDGKRKEVEWVRDESIYDGGAWAKASLLVDLDSDVRIELDDKYCYFVYNSDDAKEFDTYFQNGDVEFTMKYTKYFKIDLREYTMHPETFKVNVYPASLADYMPTEGQTDLQISDGKASVTYVINTNSTFSFSYPTEDYEILNLNSSTYFSCVKPTNTTEGNSSTISYGPIIGNPVLNIEAYQRSYISFEANIPEAIAGYSIGKKYADSNNPPFFSLGTPFIEDISVSGPTKVEYTPDKTTGALIFFSDDYFVTEAKYDGKIVSDWYVGRYQYPYGYPNGAIRLRFIMIPDLAYPGNHTIELTAIPRKDISVKLHSPENHKMTNSSHFNLWIRDYEVRGWDENGNQILWENGEILKWPGSHDQPAEYIELSLKTDNNVLVRIPEKVYLNQYSELDFAVPENISGSDLKVYTLDADGSRRYHTGSTIYFPEIMEDLDIYLEMPDPDYSAVQFKPGFEAGIDAATANFHVLRVSPDLGYADDYTEVLPDDKGSYHLAWPYECEYYVVTSSLISPKTDRLELINYSTIHPHNGYLYRISRYTSHRIEDGDITDVTWKINDHLPIRHYRLNFADDVPQFAREVIEAIPMCPDGDLMIPSVIVNPADPSESFTVSCVVYWDKERLTILGGGWLEKDRFTDVNASMGCSAVSLFNDILVLPWSGLDLCNPTEKNFCIPGSDYKDDNRVWIGGTIPGYTNGVDSISSEDEEWPKNVYSIDGRLMIRNATETMMQTLQPGIYVAGGQKVVVK